MYKLCRFYRNQQTKEIKMKLIYLLTGMLLLTPLASQAKGEKPIVLTGRAMQTLQGKQPVKCENAACAKRNEVPEGRVTPNTETVQKVFKTVFQTMEDAMRGFSKATKEWAEVLYSKAVVVGHKCAKFVGGRSASAQEQNVVSSEGMTQALQNAVLQAPKWGAQAKANLETFMKGLYTGNVLQIVEDIWGITSEQEAINKLAEIETACAI